MNNEVIQVFLGSTSQQKLIATQSVLEKLLQTPYKIIQINIDSGVPDTPWGQQTKEGARNRAGTQVSSPGIHIGLESGLIQRYDNIYEEAWACIKKDNREFYGYSSGLLVPTYITERMKQENIEHGPLMRKIRNETSLENDKDTWGLYSNYKILRQVSLEESLRNALVQILDDEHSLYKKVYNL